MGPIRPLQHFYKMARTNTQRTEDTARMAIIETDIKYIKKEIGDMKSNSKDNLNEIKVILQQHVNWETEKYDELDKKFAAKWVELGIISVATAVVAGVIILLLQTMG